MDESLNARFEFNESSVVGYAHDAAHNAALYRIPVADVAPWIGRHLLQPQGDSLLTGIELQNLNGNLLSDLNYGGRMRHVAVTQIAHVKEAVNSTQVDKSTVISEVFHYSSYDGTFGYVLQRCGFSRCCFFFEENAPGHDSIVPAAVQLQNAYRKLLTDVRIKIVDRAWFQLRTRQECSHAADVHVKAALYLSQHLAGDCTALACEFFQVFPSLLSVGALEREEYVAFGLLSAAVDHDFDYIAGMHIRFGTGQRELRCRDQTFDLPADIDNDFFLGYGKNVAMNDFAFRAAELAVVIKKRPVIFRLRSTGCFEQLINWTRHLPLTPISALYLHRKV